MRRIALAFSIALLASGQSQPPTPTKPKVTQDQKRKSTGEQDKPQRDQSATDSVSASVDKLAAEVTAWKDQESRERDKTSPPTDWGTIVSTLVTAAATVVMAVFAILQWWVLKTHHTVMETQAGYIGDALKETRKSADAATLSAKIARETLETSQRAIVAMDTVYLNPDFSKMPLCQPPQHPLTLLLSVRPEVVIKNVGPTEAMGCYMTLAAHMVYAGQIELSSDPIVSHPTTIARGKSLIQEMAPIGDLFWSDEPANLLNRFERGAELTIKGFIRYRDVFDKGWYVAITASLGRHDGKFRSSMEIWEDGKQPS